MLRGGVMKSSGKSGMNNLLLYITFGVTASAISYALGNSDSLASLIVQGGAGVLSSAINDLFSGLKSNELGKFCDFVHDKICRTKPEVSLSLQNVFEAAFQKAVSRLKREYHSIGSVKKHDDAEAIDLLFRELIERSKMILDFEELSIMPTADFGTILTGNPSQRKQLLLSKLGMEQELSAMNNYFQSFIHDKLLPYIIDAFWHELNAKGNEPAWREFQRLQEETKTYFNQQMLAKMELGIELTAQVVKRLSELKTDYGLFVEAFGYSSGEIIAMRNDLNKIIMASRLNEFQFFSETQKWIKNNLGGSGNFSPSLEEFLSGKVCVPQSLETTVMEYLNGGYDVILQGKPASGKTVFGLALAMQLCSDSTTRSIYYDLRDISDFNMTDPLDKAYQDIDLVVERLGTDWPWENRILVVLDNVHTETRFAKTLLDYIEDKRKVGLEISVLLLSRPIRKERSHRNSLSDMGNLKIVELVANEEAFFCVASRLAAQENVSLDYDESLVQDWIKQCSVDLIAFAAAFDPCYPRTLDKNKISSTIRENYLSRANTQKGGLDNFLDLCAVNSLDLDLEFYTAWNIYELQEFYPLFALDRVIETQERATLNPQITCRVFHPSLASLCLEVQKQLDPNEDKVQRLYRLCKKTLPELVGWILARMTTNEYWNPAEINRYVSLLTADTALILQANAKNPGLSLILKRMQIPVDWTVIFSDQLLYATLASSLTKITLSSLILFKNEMTRQGLSAQMNRMLHEVLALPQSIDRIKQNPPHFVADFLRGLPEEFNPEVGTIIEQIVPDSNFRKTLSNSPGDGIATFLKYLRQSAFSAHAPELIEYLLKNNQFRKRAVSTDYERTTCLLRYLYKSGYQKGVVEFVKFMLENDVFCASLDKLAFLNIVGFLYFLDEIGLASEGKTIFTELMDSSIFIKNLCSQPSIILFIPFVKFIRQRDRQQRQSIMNRFLEASSQQNLEDMIDKATDVEAASAYGYIHKLELPAYLRSALLNKAGDKFVDPYPDPEHPQKELLWMAAPGIVDLLRRESARISPFKAACIECSLMEDIEKFEEWLKKQSELDVKCLKQYSDAAELDKLQDYLASRMQ